MQTLRGELKKHLDEKLHMQVDIMYEEYNVWTTVSTDFNFIFSNTSRW